MLKDMLDIIVRLLPVALIIPTVALWTHLRSLGWSEVFLDSVVSVPGLTVLLLAGIATAAITFIQFCLPSIFLAATSHMFTEKPTGNAALLWMMLAPPVVMIVSLCALVIYFEAPALAVILATFIVTALLALGLKNKLFHRVKAPEYSGNFGKFLALSITPTFCALGISSPYLVLLPVLQRPQMSTGYALAVFAACSVGGLVSFLPGAAYLQASIAGHGQKRALRGAVFAGGVSAYVLFATVLYFAPVTSTVLRLAGGFDTSLHVYQVTNPDVVPALRSVGVAVSSTKTNIDGKHTYFAAGYMRYKFGGVTLICRMPYDPSLYSTGEVQESITSTGRDPRNAWGGGCFPAASADLRRIRPLEPRPAVVKHAMPNVAMLPNVASLGLSPRTKTYPWLADPDIQRAKQILTRTFIDTAPSKVFSNIRSKCSDAPCP
ncbi:hypothetical protein LXM60_00760 [Pandoraea sputorum]|uniref:hypothetical protein n=1 Tax=Pandoraea sputorum TaxID=93222 RepID=UPI001E5E5257|nr:hypothetical protein [Pandoraea sputorum]MCE4058739.1 hypothetical protein [Pandoraea sputorum]